MNNEGNNLKDTQKNLSLSIKDNFLPLSYSKTNKLITALYMVTDIIDDKEPVRNKMRFLGNEILSDMMSVSFLSMSDRANVLLSNIKQMLTFLDISSTVGIVSSMNAGILSREFSSLKLSIEEVLKNHKPFWGYNSLEDFLQSEYSEASLNQEDLNEKKSQNYLSEEAKEVAVKSNVDSRQFYNGHSIRQAYKTKLGVQKVGNLMRVLSDKVSDMNSAKKTLVREDKSMVKKERRYEIVKILKNQKNGLTISDIISKAEGVLKECGEKTIQRELVSMVDDGVLKKEGTKRWSTYSVIEKN